MQQQIQQHQRQLAQALLMKQQQQQQPSHSGLHPGAKSSLDSYPGHPQTPVLPDLQTKEPQSTPNTYSPYALCKCLNVILREFVLLLHLSCDLLVPPAGLNPNMNPNCIDVGSLPMKDPPLPQSRLSQWTHPNSIESLSGNSSPLEPNLGKHGERRTGSWSGWESFYQQTQRRVFVVMLVSGCHVVQRSEVNAIPSSTPVLCSFAACLSPSATVLADYYKIKATKTKN